MTGAIDHPAVRSNVALGPMTTYKVGGPAEFFVEPTDLEELRSVLASTPRGMSITVLGRGSNVVISDAGVAGLVIRMAGAFTAVDIVGADLIVAGGAAPLPVLARFAAQHGRSGLGFYVGIPGSVGGAVRMNAGGHGSQTSEVLIEATILDLRSGEMTRRSASALDLSYRHSNLTDDDLVVQGRFRTGSAEPEDLEAELREITRWRKEHQPGGTFNAGSVFKNPADEAAGSIIDRLGLKGTSVGPVTVSPLHANFLTAERGAKATDIHAFVRTIQQHVAEETGIMLEPEIRFIGDFSDDDGSTT